MNSCVLNLSLDPDQKEELVTVLDKLLADRTTLVVGSAVMAFEEVCNFSGGANLPRD